MKEAHQMKLGTLFLWLVLFILFSSLENAIATDEVNLGRTSLATVNASSVNGNGSLSDPYHGVLNLFDNGENRINGINYDYWLSGSGSARQWVELTFATPVKITSIDVDSDFIEAAKQYRKADEEAPKNESPLSYIRGYYVEVPFSVQVESADTVQTYQGKNGKLIFDPFIQGVRKVKILFYPKPSTDSNLVEIHEIKVLGYRPSVPFEERKPNILLSDDNVLKRSHKELLGWLHSIDTEATYRIVSQGDSKVVIYSLDGTDIFRARINPTGTVQGERLAKFAKSKTKQQKQKAVK
jgi:hypothetical protein